MSVSQPVMPCGYEAENTALLQKVEAVDVPAFGSYVVYTVLIGGALSAVHHIHPPLSKYAVQGLAHCALHLLDSNRIDRTIEKNTMIRLLTE